MRFVVIDDSESDRYLARRAITKAFGEAPVEYKAAFLAIEDFLDPIRAAEIFGFGERLVLLLDIHMPRMSGFEFLERLGESVVADMVVVLMFTSSKLAVDRTKSESSPFVKGFIVKPLMSSQLVALVSELGLEP